MKVKLNCNGIEFMAEISDEDIRKFTKSKEEFEKGIKRVGALYNNMLRRSAEICDKIDWNNGKEDKYLIGYCYATKEIRILAVNYTKDMFQIYFDTKEHAKQVAEEFRDELIWYFTEFKERMD